MYQGQKSQTKLTDSCRYPRILCSALSDSVLPSRGIESAVEHGQSFLFDISSLPDAYEVVNAELRVLPWRSPEPDPDSATLPPLLHLFVCPDAARTSHLLHSRTAEPLEVACWEELDVTDAVQSLLQILPGAADDRTSGWPGVAAAMTLVPRSARCW